MNDQTLLQLSRDTIERGSKSFAAASRLLPQRVRDSAHLLYTWCRYCDDAIDGQHLGFADASLQHSKFETLEYLTDRTRRVLAGEDVDETPFRALGRLITRNEISRSHPLSHLLGYDMDVRGETYHTLDDTIRYCYHVAGVVGVMMAQIMGVRDRDTLDRAADLGIAFQLTNIARDVIDDAKVGRVYLPREWLNAHGIEADDVAHPKSRAALAKVVACLLDEADRYYDSARLGITRLPFRVAWSIAAARSIYRDIGRLVREHGPRAWDRRVSVSPYRKAMWVMVAGAAVAAKAEWDIATAPERTGLWPIPREAEPVTRLARQRSVAAAP